CWLCSFPLCWRIDRRSTPRAEECLPFVGAREGLRSGKRSVDRTNRHEIRLQRWQPPSYDWWQRLLGRQSEKTRFHLHAEIRVLAVLARERSASLPVAHRPRPGKSCHLRPTRSGPIVAESRP